MQRIVRDVPLGDGLLSISVWEPVSPLFTLLCFHGWTLDHRSFVGQHILAEHGIRLVTFDRRGFGSNALPPGLDRELADVEHLLHHLPEPVYGYGVSQGARLLLRYAAQAPTNLAGLIIQGGLVDGLPVEDDEIPYEHYASLLEAGNQKAFSQEWLAHPLMRSGVPSGMLPAVADLVTGYEGRDLVGRVQNSTHLDLTEMLPRVCATGVTPLWVIEAEQESETRRAHARFLIEECGGVAVPMPGGHLCQFTHADVFNRRLLGALRGVSHRADGGE
jgi:pimeloyl-ACP methyl ester carboxylesterase